MRPLKHLLATEHYQLNTYSVWSEEMREYTTVYGVINMDTEVVEYTTRGFKNGQEVMEELEKTTYGFKINTPAEPTLIQ